MQISVSFNCDECDVKIFGISKLKEKLFDLPSYSTPSLFLTAYQSLHVERTFWLDEFRPYKLHTRVVLKCKLIIRRLFPSKSIG